MSRISFSSIDASYNILHPNIVNVSTASGSLELWNKGNTITTLNNNTIYKTIYSPSPANYEELKPTAFTGLTTTGSNSNSYNEFNVNGSWQNGWYIYCLPNFTGQTLFFGAMGYIINGNLGGVNFNGIYWTGGAASSTTAFDLNILSDRMWTQQIESRASAFIIYLAKE